MKTTMLILLFALVVVSCKKKEDTFNWRCKSYTTVSWSKYPIDSTIMGLSDATEKEAREQERVATYKKSVWNEETGEHDFAQVTTTCVKQ